MSARFSISLGQALFAPRSIAVIGASDDPAKTAGRPLLFLRRAGFKGAIYPVNPRRDTVLGERAWPSVAALPDVPDHAYIVTPTELVLAALEECGRAGVQVASILANGFSESGAQGLEREMQLRAICRRTGIRVVGPNSLGVVNVHARSMITANAAFAEPELPHGGIFVASHSGSMIGALVSRGKERGIGFAGLVSVGNEADLGIGDICMATLDDPGIRGYLLFLETLRHAASLRAFALAAAAQGKPVVAYKLGRSAAAAELAVSHTGALAGEDDVAATFLRDCGIARVETLEGLIECLPLFSRMPVAARGAGRVGVLTTTGGGAAMVVDQLGLRGVNVQRPSDDTFRRLAEAGVKVGHGAIVDLTLAGTRYDVMKAAIDVLSTAPEFDLVVAVAGSSARYHPDLAVRPIIDSKDGPRPLVAFLVPEAPQALALLSAAGVPNFRTPEACADAIAAALGRRAPRLLPVAPPPSGPLPDGGRMLDELQAYALLARLGVPHAPVMALDAACALPPVPLAYPLAVKVLHADIAHKTDVGGVILGVADADALAVAVRTIASQVAARRPGTTVERVLAQTMVQGLGEVLVGYRVDAQAGPLVMLAAGGVLAEIYRDRSMRLAPVDLETAHEMIGEVKSLQSLAGYRGKPRGDLDALAAAIVAVSGLALLDDVQVLDAEINPLIVHQAGQGVTAVDALVRLA